MVLNSQAHFTFSTVKIEIDPTRALLLIYKTQPLFIHSQQQHNSLPRSGEMSQTECPLSQGRNEDSNVMCVCVNILFIFHIYNITYYECEYVQSMREKFASPQTTLECEYPQRFSAQLTVTSNTIETFLRLFCPFILRCS